MFDQYDLTAPCSPEEHAEAYRLAASELLHRSEGMDPTAGMMFTSMAALAGAIGGGYVEVARQRVESRLADQPAAEVIPFDR